MKFADHGQGISIGEILDDLPIIAYKMTPWAGPLAITGYNVSTFRGRRSLSSIALGHGDRWSEGPWVAVITWPPGSKPLREPMATHLSGIAQVELASWVQRERKPVPATGVAFAYAGHRLLVDVYSGFACAGVDTPDGCRIAILSSGAFDGLELELVPCPESAVRALMSPPS
jgi:hypothetical protein